MQLIDALWHPERPVMAFVGAGGKTSAIFTLAREIIHKSQVENGPKTVLVTTSTHLGSWQAKLADHIILESSLKLEQIFKNSMPAGVVLIAGEEKDDRLSGLNQHSMDGILTLAKRQNLPLLIEADGSKNLPLKAPAEHEPAIPEFVDRVVVVAGLSAIGEPLNQSWVHHPDIFSKLSGVGLDQMITPEALVNVLLSPQGGLKNIPSHATRIALLNQADAAILRYIGRTIAQKICCNYQITIIASLPQYEPVRAKSQNKKSSIYAVIKPIAGIILAAGGSSRFGKPKQLLEWNGSPFIQHVVSSAQEAGLDPIIVVTGSASEEVSEAISDLPVRIVKNNQWKDGISTSIKAGLLQIPPEVGGAIFLLADQPQISPMLIKKIIERHQETLAPIVAPEIRGMRGNPVLFDARTFKDLFTLDGDVGGRAIFSKYHIEKVPWQAESQLFDVDKPEDYDEFLEIHPS